MWKGLRQSPCLQPRVSVSHRGGTCGFSHYEVSVLIPHIFPRCWSILVLRPKLQAQSSETFEGGVTVDLRL